MQEFFMDYGLWLLVALLVLIGVVFLLSGRRRNEPAAPPQESEAPAPVLPLAAAAPPSVPEAPVEPAVVPPAPAPVETVAEPVEVESPAPAVEEAPVPAEPAPIPASPAVAAPAEGADDLLKLKGVGPKLAALLTELGVTRYAQIAGWSEGDIAAIDARLGNFKGRPVRDQWIDQAKYLAAGDVAGFEAKYGKL